MGYLRNLVEKNNQFRQAHPQLGLSEYTTEKVYQALNEHRLAAFGRIDSDLEAGRISANEAQRQKDAWDTNHSYR